MLYLITCTGLLPHAVITMLRMYIHSYFCVHTSGIIKYNSTLYRIRQNICRRNSFHDMSGYQEYPNT